MRLAKDRLFCYLKSRLERYGEEPAVANKLSQTELERVNGDIAHLNEQLCQLERKHDALDKIVARAKHEKINPSVEREREADRLERDRGLLRDVWSGV